MGGCLWPWLAGSGFLGSLLPQQSHTGSIEAGTFLSACVTGGGGEGRPAPTDPEGPAAPGRVLDAAQHIWRS